MATTRRSLPSFEFVPYFLAGLGPDYDPLVSSVTIWIEPIGIEELLGHLLIHEACLQHHIQMLLCSHQMSLIQTLYLVDMVVTLEVMGVKTLVTNVKTVAVVVEATQVIVKTTHFQQTLRFVLSSMQQGRPYRPYLQL